LLRACRRTDWPALLMAFRHALSFDHDLILRGQ
jgi:hypothetical protein